VRGRKVQARRTGCKELRSFMVRTGYVVAACSEKSELNESVDECQVLLYVWSFIPTSLADQLEMTMG
jgi:hypothetical protein